MAAVYLDNNATTRLDHRVFDAMLPWLQHVGNAASAHAGGQAAARAVEDARRDVAELLGTAARDVVFTSGATEANNLAVKGAAAASVSGARRRVVTVATEHPSVLASVAALRASGFDVQIAQVDAAGRLDLGDLADLVDESTLLVSVMAANNETGVVTPLPDVAHIVKARGALLHTDATQLGAWGPIDVDTLHVDLLSLSAHKMHGPQGVGALYVRRGTQLRALIDGGGHERGLRSGTANTAGIVGFGLAARLAAEEGPTAANRTAELRDELQQLLEQATVRSELNGDPARRLPGTLNLTFPGADAEAVMAGTPDVHIATGSACSTGHPGPSHVLTAMGRTSAQAACALRLGLSRDTTSQEVQFAAASIAQSVRTVRERSAT